MIKKLSKVLAALAMSAAVIIAGCSSEGGSSKGPATVAATGVTVTDGNGSSEGNLFIGEEDTITLTATVTPENATVIINNVEQSSIELPYATNIEIVVKANGYKSYSNSFILTENKTTQINLEKIEITENQE